MKSRLEYEAHMDHLAVRLAGRVRASLRFFRERLESLRGRLRSPQEKLAWQAQKCDDLFHRLSLAIDNRIRTGKAEVAARTGRLESLSPLRTLARGYAVVRKNETIIRRSEDLAVDDLVSIDFSAGAVTAMVREVFPEDMD